jgi:lipoyl(octanoyl) transferase
VDWSRACFGAPQAGELVVGGRKLVGSAQRTEGRFILQHGSILLGGTQAATEDLLLDRTPLEIGTRTQGRGGGWTTLTAELGRRPEIVELESALAHGFEAVFGTSLAPGVLTAGEASDAHRLRERFASPAWTWRR